MKIYTFDEIKDKHIGKKGTKKRDEFEFKIRLDLIGHMIKATRKQRQLTQEELGKLVGVKKAQISKLESNAGNVTIETLIKIFQALKAEINFDVQLLDVKATPTQAKAKRVKSAKTQATRA